MPIETTTTIGSSTLSDWYTYYYQPKYYTTTTDTSGNWYTTNGGTISPYIQWQSKPAQATQIEVVEKEVVKLIEPASGVWKDTDRDVIVCSECGYETQYVNRSKRYRYCPNCGAKMKPEE